MASGSFSSDLSNIAKTCTKMSKKLPFLYFFWFSEKTLHAIRTIFLHSIYIKLVSLICNYIRIVWLGPEILSLNWSKKGCYFSIFFQYPQKQFITVFILLSFYNHFDHQNRLTGLWETSQNLSKMTKLQSKQFVFPYFIPFWLKQHWFLDGTFINKKPDYYCHSFFFFFQDGLGATNVS